MATPYRVPLDLNIDDIDCGSGSTIAIPHLYPAIDADPSDTNVDHFVNNGVTTEHLRCTMENTLVWCLGNMDISSSIEIWSSSPNMILWFVQMSTII